MDGIVIKYKPNSGHEIRSKLLADAFRNLGFEVVEEPTVPLGKWPGSVTIYDMPPEDLPSVIVPGKTVLMGVVAPRVLCWHPLGPPGSDVITGLEYLIVPPDIPRLEPVEKYVCYMGSSKLASLVYFTLHDHVEILQDLQHADFLRKLSTARGALLGWGQSCFEASMLGVPFLAIASSPEHVAESWRFGVPAMPMKVAKLMLPEIPDVLGDLMQYGPHLSGGAMRTAKEMIRRLEL